MKPIKKDKPSLCPFCGSEEIVEAGQDAWWQMLCENCHAAGPSAGSPDDALKYWNDRSKVPLK